MQTIERLIIEGVWVAGRNLPQPISLGIAVRWWPRDRA